jgi:hypothetical protein
VGDVPANFEDVKLELELTPRVEVVSPAPWRVTSVEVLPGARLRVRFIDGTTGEVHMQPFLQAPATAGSVFEPLRDPVLLAQAAIVSGAVEWPNGADLAPDAMYDAIRERGVWLLS